MRIQVILGSTRQGRFGERVGRWFHSVGAARDDLEAELVDLRDWPLPFFDGPRPPMSGEYVAEARPWAEKVAQGDGYVLVTPEYNHGYPAVLKNALDHIYAEWNSKPLAIVSYGGPAGGTRAMEQLVQVAIELQMAPIRESFPMPFARRLFDEDGKLTDESYERRANRLLDQLVWWARALNAARSDTSLAAP